MNIFNGSPLVGGTEVQPLDESELPLLLPDVKSYEPTGTGESPLAGILSWVEHKDPKTGRQAYRDEKRRTESSALTGGPPALEGGD